jgi:hypothetical protein
MVIHFKTINLKNNPGTLIVYCLSGELIVTRYLSNNSCF